MSHIDPTSESLAAFLGRGIEGSVVMLNLLRFRESADYSSSPELAPDNPISGKDAYDAYMAAVTPLVAEVGGELLFMGSAAGFLIGPSDESWDLALIVSYPAVMNFAQMATSDAYKAIAGHRTAALADSRLLPMEPAA